MTKYICIHGHFYQPPRENPWLEEVELQDSAYPYHDWNERITAECYAPNCAARILADERRVIDIRNNYARSSFNFGPTFLSWMQRKQPDVYRSIIESDLESIKTFSGHGSALAQVYNHMIMPLASARDKRTQVIWGIRDFVHRFKRKPEGMWLAEAAVDLETLDILAEHGIAFTILAPRQAHRVRRIGDNDWQDVSNATINPRMPYLCRLPSGRSIALFFYDGPISSEIGFGNLLDNGENLARRLLGAFPGETGAGELVSVATDGETYGHHHRHGDMALSYCLYYLEANNLDRITIYGEFLEKHPPTHEVEVYENSSWSCIHGVERWRANCGCNSGMHGGWTQEWRAPLRRSMDWLRDMMVPLYEQEISQYLHSPWQARDEYIEVMLDRSLSSVKHFLQRHRSRALTGNEETRVLKLLEMQRQNMLMYTSCGWFFDEISGIETVQCMQYAFYAMQLAREVTGIDLEQHFISMLEKAPSNIPELGNGGEAWRRYVQPSRVDIYRVCTQYAVSSLFRQAAEDTKLYGYTALNEAYDRIDEGKQKLAIGRTRIRSDKTGEEKHLMFAVFHLGDHNLNSAVRPFETEEAYKAMHHDLRQAFTHGNLNDVYALMSKHFDSHNYSLWHLFKDEQRAIMDHILADTVAEVGLHFNDIFENHFQVVQVMRELDIPVPKYLSVIVGFILNRNIQTVLSEQKINCERLAHVVEEAAGWGYEIDKSRMALTVIDKLNVLMNMLLHAPKDLQLMESIVQFIASLQPLGLDLNLWRIQNTYFAISRTLCPQIQEEASHGSAEAARWMEMYHRLGDSINVRCM
jgi:alpha-amylase/alpha-mannosidase (GH57 family)